MRHPEDYPADIDPFESLPYLMFDPETGAIRQTGRMPRFVRDHKIERGDAILPIEVDENDLENYVVNLDTKRLNKARKHRAASKPVEPPVSGPSLAHQFMMAFKRAADTDEAFGASLPKPLKDFLRTIKGNRDAS